MSLRRGVAPEPLCGGTVSRSMPACTACARRSTRLVLPHSLRPRRSRADPPPAASWRDLEILGLVACLGAPALAGFHRALRFDSPHGRGRVFHAASSARTAPRLAQPLILRSRCRGSRATRSASPRPRCRRARSAPARPARAARRRASAGVPARLEHVALAGIADDDAARSLAARAAPSRPTAGPRWPPTTSSPSGYGGAHRRSASLEDGGGLVDYLTADRAVVPPAAAAAIPSGSACCRTATRWRRCRSSALLPPLPSPPSAITDRSSPFARVLRLRRRILRLVRRAAAHAGRRAAAARRRCADAHACATSPPPPGLRGGGSTRIRARQGGAHRAATAAVAAVRHDAHLGAHDGGGRRAARRVDAHAAG